MNILSGRTWAILAASGAVVVASVGVCIHVLMQDGSQVDDEDLSTPSESMAGAVRTDGSVRVGVGVTSERAMLDGASGGAADGKVASVAATPAEEEDDRLMNEVVKELMEQLTEACKSRDYKRVLALADKLRALNYGAGTRLSSACASSVKRSVLAALADVGASAIDQIADLVNDSDPVVAQDATSLIFKTLGSLAIGDYQRADIVVEVATEMKDDASLTRLYNEFVKMRHSVGADALLRISNSGTPEAREQLPRVISAFTGDITITSVDQLGEWLDENPDSGWDDHRYGPIISNADLAN